MPTALASDSVQIPEKVQKQLQRHADSMTMLPGVAMQALEVARNPDCSIAEFARIVERDVKLATDMLAMANSALFAGTSPLASLHQAIVRLGLRQCKNLIYASSMNSLMKRLSNESAATRERLWRHSFHTAIIALHLNHSCGMGFQGEEFTAGLLHDVGRILLSLCLPDRSGELDLMDLDGAPRLLQTEHLLLDTNHCELGAYFAARNSLPNQLAQAIRHHHEPWNSQRHLRLVALTSAADHMANHLQRYGGPEGYESSTNPALAILEGTGMRGLLQKFSSMHAVLMRNALYDAKNLMQS